MKVGRRMLFVLILYTAIISVISALFVILYFRVFPNKPTLVYPSIFLFGLLVGLISFIPFRSLVEKNDK